MKPWEAGRHTADARVVLARRNDGLGERLNALLNAMRMADLLGVDFRFSWPEMFGDKPQHAIVPAEQFFAADFLAAHLIDDADAWDGYAAPAGHAKDLEALRLELTSAERGLVAPNRWLGKYVDKTVPGIRGGFSGEFARIGFHPQIETAIDAARAVPLGDKPVGLHLRAGDVFHGTRRSWNRLTSKVMPAPVARELIARFRADGSEVVVSGQDQEVIDELCATHGAIDAASLRRQEDWSKAADAMFDIVVMSRCERIIGGNSGFVRQAAIIGDKSVEDFRTLVPPAEIVTVTRADIARNGERYSPVQLGFAWWAAFYFARSQLSGEEAIDLVGRAQRADPTNPQHRLWLATLCFRDRQHERGDDALRDALIADAAADHETLESVLLFSHVQDDLRTRPGQRRYDSAEIHPDIEQAVDAGSGAAAIYRAALRASRSDRVGANEDLDRFLSHAESDPRLSDVAGLDALAMATVVAQDPAVASGSK